MNDTKACADKMVFETPAAAQAVATTEKFRTGIKLKTYKCSFCTFWHLASN